MGNSTKSGVIRGGRPNVQIGQCVVGCTGAPGHHRAPVSSLYTDDEKCARAIAVDSSLRRDAVGQKRLQRERVGCDRTDRAAPAAFLKVPRTLASPNAQIMHKPKKLWVAPRAVKCQKRTHRYSKQQCL